MSIAADPHPLTLQMLAWLERSPRTYAETMDAWRTSCPRFPIWEDALSDQLIQIARVDAGDGRRSSMVELTARGGSVLERFGRS